MRWMVAKRAGQIDLPIPLRETASGLLVKALAAAGANLVGDHSVYRAYGSCGD